jgi:Bardet-Biedl syndrome 2 protein
LLWITNNFIFTDEFETENELDFIFLSVRDKKPLTIKMIPNGQITIKTDDMELAGNLIQSLLAYLNITDLQVNCDFPEEMEKLQDILKKVTWVKRLDIFGND